MYSCILLENFESIFCIYICLETKQQAYKCGDVKSNSSGSILGIINSGNKIENDEIKLKKNKK